MRLEQNTINRQVFITATAAFVVSCLLGAWVSYELGGVGHLRGDSRDYFAQATDFLRGWDAIGAFYWPPGTALVVSSFLRAVGSVSPVVGWAASCLFQAADAALIVLLSAVLVGTRSIRASAVLAVCYPTFLLTSGQTDSHIFALFWALIVALCALFGARGRNQVWFAIAGLALGMAALTRPAMGLLGLFVPWVVLVESRAEMKGAGSRIFGRAAMAGLLALCSLGVVLAPVLLHNHKQGAGWVISTNNQRNFFLGNNKYTPLYRTWHFASRSLEQLPPDVSSYLRSMYRRPHPRESMVRAAAKEIQGHPGRFLLRTINRICAFWGADYQAARQLQQIFHLTPLWAALLFGVQAGGYWGLAILVLIGTFSGEGGEQAHLRRLLWPTIGLLLLPYALAFSAPTYHFEALGLLFPIAAQGFERVHNRVSAGGWYGVSGLLRERAVLLALMAFAAVQVEFLLLVRGA